MSPTTQSDAFHEIQLNGKQLVFLFMAATVVSVAIFLCGVLVGRGVRAERTGTAGETAALNGDAPAEITPQQPPQVAPPPSAGSDPTAAAPPPAVDDLSYFNRLEKQNPPTEELKPAPEKSTPEQAVAARVETAARSSAPQVAKETASLPAEPGGQGYALQIAALGERDEADAIAKRLTSKGYPAYVLVPASGAPAVYRVRVGKFKTRRDAETVALKLHEQEQFNPWITK